MDYHGNEIGHKMSGFASPSQGYEEQGIDLNRLLVKNQSSTYFFRLETEEMAEMGLSKGALLIIDRSLKPAHNSLAIIKHEGAFLCRLVTKENGKYAFSNGNSTITPIMNETEIIGKVTACIQEF